MPPDAEVSLIFVDEASIADLNGRFLEGDGPTDVLVVPHRRRPAPERPASRHRRARPGLAGRGRRPADRARRRRGVPDGGAAARRPSTRHRSTTSSRCSSCTVCSTSSTTTTPRSSTPQAMQQRERELLAAPPPRRREARTLVSGADWALLARRDRAVRRVDLARGGRDRVRAHEPDPRHRARRRRATSAPGGSRRCSSNPEQTLNVVLLARARLAAHQRDAPRCAARGHGRRARAS